MGSVCVCESLCAYVLYISLAALFPEAESSEVPVVVSHVCRYGVTKNVTSPVVAETNNEESTERTFALGVFGNDACLDLQIQPRSGLAHPLRLPPLPSRLPPSGRRPVGHRQWTWSSAEKSVRISPSSPPVCAYLPSSSPFIFSKIKKCPPP